jgi:hypothetical protein
VETAQERPAYERLVALAASRKVNSGKLSPHGEVKGRNGHLRQIKGHCGGPSDPADLPLVNNRQSKCRCKFRVDATLGCPGIY